MGLGQGAEFDILPYAISRYFGLRAFGEIYGYTFAAVTLGAAIGPLVMGVSFDATGSYSLALISFAVATFTAAGLMTWLRAVSGMGASSRAGRRSSVRG